MKNVPQESIDKALKAFVSNDMLPHHKVLNLNLMEFATVTFALESAREGMTKNPLNNSIDQRNALKLIDGILKKLVEGEN